MHLLRRESDGEFSLTEYYGEPPPYAILSHTWGSDSDEVTFKDITKSRGKSKSGYEKLRFCAAQAEKDGLEYFWVDTCCIDKRDSVKLSEAINSMYWWYQCSAKCYVYLTDVATSGPALDTSKWFTRGWTLQELLAPSSVEFFASDHTLLGDKFWLSGRIHRITGIPVQALQAKPLSPSDFSIDERMSWAKGRETKREEDAAYCLLGLFGVHMPPIYGERRSNAFARLGWEIERKAATERRTGVVTTGEGPRGDVADAKRLPTASNLNPSKARLAVFQENVLPTTETLESSEIVNVSETQLVEVNRWYKHRPSRDRRTQGDVKDMESWWKKAIGMSLNNTRAYTRVSVLLVRWAEASAKRRQEVEDLETLFRAGFQFDTQIVVLDARSKVQLQMDRHISEFILKNDGPHNLLIIYYTGHGYYSKSQGGLQLWSTVHKSHFRFPPQVNWHKSEDILRSDDVEADILMLLDTQYAPKPAIDHTTTGSPSEKNKSKKKKKNTKHFELISACEIGERPASPGPGSFTHALIHALTTQANEDNSEPLSTLRLNQQICMNPQRNTSSTIWFSSASTTHIGLLGMVKASGMTWQGQFGMINHWQTQRKGKGYVKLGLELRDDGLTERQIEKLVQILAELRGEEGVGLCSADWLGFEVKRTSIAMFSRAVHIIMLIQRWKRLALKEEGPGISWSTAATPGVL